MKMRTLDKFNLGIVILILSSSFLSHNANNVICKTLDKINIDKRFLYYEEIHVEVYANGSISVWVESLVKNSFFNTSDVSAGLEISEIRVKRTNPVAHLFILYNLNIISSEEADMYADKLSEKWISTINGHKTLLEKKQTSFASPLSGKIYNYKEYHYILNGISFEKVKNLFIKSKDNCGFLDLINGDNIEKCTELRFEISRDEAGLIRYKLTFYRHFPYFNFKVGNTYVLDLLSLFNFTGPLRINSKSFFSLIDIILHAPYNSKFVIVEAKMPSELQSERSGSWIEITNGPVRNLNPNEVFKEFYIKFKVVESGFKLPSFSPLTQFLGVILIAISIVILLVIYYLTITKNK